MSAPVPPLLSCWDGWSSPVLLQQVVGGSGSSSLDMVCRVAQTPAEERALLAERVPQELLDSWGPITASLLAQANAPATACSRLSSWLKGWSMQGMNRRCLLLHLRKEHMERLIVPNHVKEVLLQTWAVINVGVPQHGLAQAVGHVSCSCICVHRQLQMCDIDLPV